MSDTSHSAVNMPLSKQQTDNVSFLFEMYGVPYEPENVRKIDLLDLLASNPDAVANVQIALTMLDTVKSLQKPLNAEIERLNLALSQAQASHQAEKFTIIETSKSLCNNAVDRAIRAEQRNRDMADFIEKLLHDMPD